MKGKKNGEQWETAMEKLHLVLKDVTLPFELLELSVLT